VKPIAITLSILSFKKISLTNFKPKTAKKSNMKAKNNKISLNGNKKLILKKIKIIEAIIKKIEVKKLMEKFSS
jgi:hypothetical protein